MIPSRFSNILFLAAAVLSIGLSVPAFADTPASLSAASLSAGDTAWVLTATALVLFMTIPGLALFYGGLVRSQSVLSVLMHCLSICCLVSVLWLMFGYGLAFGDGGALNKWIGFGKIFLTGVHAETLKGTIPETVFFMFQMTFAIITPALIIGAYVERVKFIAVIAFSGLWLIFVYAPVAHWVWGGGWLAGIGVMDFAGGLVVHTTAGMAAIVIATVIRSRVGFPVHAKPPHNTGMTLTGMAMLWVGWFGFNAGSALTAGGNAGMAMTVTHVSAATAAIVWMSVEWIKHGRPTLVGLATGAVAGLATITPASGYVGPIGGFCIGLFAGFSCYYCTAFVKNVLKIDDSLDVMAVHGVGGASGVLLTALFAAGGLGGLGLAEGRSIGGQLAIQACGLAATALWSGVVSYGLLRLVDAWVGFTVSKEDEIEGLDIRTHGERAYEF